MKEQKTLKPKWQWSITFAVGLCSLLRGFTIAELSHSQPRPASADRRGTELMEHMERALEIAIATHFSECEAEHPLCLCDFEDDQYKAAEVDL
jgi:hypothetical protein